MKIYKIIGFNLFVKAPNKHLATYACFINSYTITVFNLVEVDNIPLNFGKIIEYKYDK